MTTETELNHSIVFVYISENIMPEHNEFFITKEHAISIIERVYGVTHIGKMYQKHHEEFTAAGLVAVVDNINLGLLIKYAIEDPTRGEGTLTNRAYFQMNFHFKVLEQITLEDVKKGAVNPDLIAPLLHAAPAFRIQEKHFLSTLKIFKGEL